MTVAPVDVEEPRESNMAFARRVGCNHTMASRLRSGHRMPSTEMLIKICDTYGLSKTDALDRYGEGAESFSAWLREHIFGEPESDEADAVPG